MEITENKKKKEVKPNLRKTYMTSDKRGQNQMIKDIEYQSDYMIALKRGEDLTRFKHGYYKDIYKSKEDVIKSRISKRGKFSWLTKLLHPFIEEENEVAIVRLENELHTNAKMMASYEQRVKEDEAFIEKIGEEMNNCFESVLEEAKTIDSNIRLQDAIAGFTQKQKEGLVNQRSKIEFYVFLKSEIKNNIIHGNGKNKNKK